MTAFVTIPNTDIDQDSPGTQPLFTALRDNPIAIAEGDSVGATPVNQAMWHPYNMTAVNDGNDGVIYDFGVDGAVASISTPDFVDGYEYALAGDSIQGTSTTSFEVEFWRETDAAWSAAQTINGSTTGGSSMGFWLYCPMPRFARQGAVLIGYSASNSSGHNAVNVGFNDTTSQKIGRLRLAWASGNIDAGTITMFRRRDLGSI